MAMSLDKQHRVLEELLRTGWLKRERYDAIMMAADSSPRRSGELLKFAARVGYLDRVGVHVVDAIRMATMTNPRRRLNLGWSRRRWCDEHEALTRQLTARMRREEVDFPFDTRWIENVLAAAPGDASISIFTSSMDLVREGEVQRHCIATYAGQFRRGSLSGVSLVLEGHRWTVTIKPPAGGRNATVYKIHGRRNETPSASTRRRILHALGPEIADTEPAVPVRPYTSGTETSGWEYRYPGPRLI